MKFCHWNGIDFEHDVCHWNGMETDQENLQGSEHKNISFDHKKECLTMKLKQILTMKLNCWQSCPLWNAIHFDLS